MTHRPTSRLHFVFSQAAVSSLLLLSACAQGIQLSTSQVISVAGMIGDAVDRSTRSRGSERSSGSASSGTSVRIPRSPAPTAATARTLQTADRFVGTTYVWGGNTPDSGFDCSGFTKYVFARQGIPLPRTAREQARVGEGVALDFSAFRPGDLLFFAEPREAISHVAIYVGDGRIIHASSAMGQVGYLDLDGDRAAWYIQNMVAVRRLQ